MAAEEAAPVAPRLRQPLPDFARLQANIKKFKNYTEYKNHVGAPLSEAQLDAAEWRFEGKKIIWVTNSTVYLTYKKAILAYANIKGYIHDSYAVAESATRVVEVPPPGLPPKLVTEPTTTRRRPRAEEVQ